MLYELLTSKPPFFRGDLLQLCGCRFLTTRRYHRLRCNVHNWRSRGIQFDCVERDDSGLSWPRSRKTGPQSAKRFAQRLWDNEVPGSECTRLVESLCSEETGFGAGIALGAAAAGFFALCLMAYVYWPRSTAITPVVPDRKPARLNRWLRGARRVRLLQLLR